MLYVSFFKIFLHVLIFLFVIQTIPASIIVHYFTFIFIIKMGTTISKKNAVILASVSFVGIGYNIHIM